MSKIIVATTAMLLAFSPAIAAEEDCFEVEQIGSEVVEFCVDIEAIPEKTHINKPIENTVNEHIFANIEAEHLKLSNTSRYSYGATAGIDYVSKGNRLYLGTNVSKQEFGIILKKRSSSHDDSLPDEKEFKISQEIATIEEAFVEKSFGNFVMSAGRSRINFSESPNLTTMSYIMPRKSLYDGLGGRKLAYVIPQDNIQFLYKIKRDTEVRAIYIKGANIDPYIKKATKLANQSIWDGSSWSETPGTIEPLKDRDSKILTLTVYPSWGKTQFLYSDGYDMNQLVNHGKVTRVGGSKNPSYFNVARRHGVERAKSYGFSAEIGQNKPLTYGFEFLHIKTNRSLFSYSEVDSDTTSEYEAFNNHIVDKNGGKLIVPVNYNLVSFNVNYKKDNYKIHGNIMASKQNFFGVGQTAIDLAKSAGMMSNPNKVDKTIFTGGISSTYSFDKNNDRSISAFVGLMANIGGLGLGYDHKLNDKINIGVSSVIGKMYSVEQIAEILGSDDYKEKEEIEKFIGLSISYKL